MILSIISKVLEKVGKIWSSHRVIYYSFIVLLNSYSTKQTYYPTPKSVFKNTNTSNIIFLRLMNSEWNENWCVPSLGPAWVFLKVWGIFIAYFSRKIKNKVEEYYTLQHMERNKTFSKSTNGGWNYHVLES